MSRNGCQTFSGNVFFQYATIRRLNGRHAVVVIAARVTLPVLVRLLRRLVVKRIHITLVDIVIAASFVVKAVPRISLTVIVVGIITVHATIVVAIILTIIRRRTTAVEGFVGRLF